MSEHRPIAVITGAAQGIGRRTAEVLAERGYRLALLDLNPCKEALDAATRLGAEAMDFVGNVTDEAFVQATASEVQKRFAAPAVVVNNAGISFIKRSEDTTVAEFRRVLEVNLIGPWV